MKKNIAKNIFIWSMIVLFAIAGGCFIAEMYIDFNNDNCVSAEVAGFTRSVGSAYSFAPDNVSYYCDYSVLVDYSNYIVNSSSSSDLNFSFNSYNKIYNNEASQYFLSSVNFGSSVSGSSVNVFPFSFSLSIDTISVNSFSILNTGAVYCYSNGSSFGNYTLSTNSLLSNLHYYLVSSSTSSFSSIVGYTSGNFVKYGNNWLGNWFDNFINFSALTDFANTQIEDGSWYFLSLFDSNYNRLTLFVQVGSSTSSVVDIDYTHANELFFSNIVNSDLNDYYNKGYDNGYNIGYNAGHSQGVLDANEYSFLGLIGAVVDAPIAAFTGLFNFSILGVNLKDFLAGLLTICIVIVVVRLILVK